MKARVERNSARDVVSLRIDAGRDLFAASRAVASSGIIAGETIVLRSEWEMVGAEVIAVDGGSLHVRLLADLADDTREVAIVTFDVWIAHQTKTCACDACARYRRTRGIAA